jgi:hypothetical protein
MRLLVAILLLGCSDTVAQVIHGRSNVETAQVFSANHPWTTSVESVPVDPRSSAMLTELTANGGFGTGAFRIDFNPEVLTVAGDTPFRTFEPNDEFWAPDCDRIPFPMPIGGALSGETGYRCTADNDCFLLVIDPGKRKLYEMRRADYDGVTFRGGCAVVWDLNKQYGANLRGKGCTSTESAGLPLVPLLATADEVNAGSVQHALHFSLPNDRLRRGIYVPPASHSTGNTSAGVDGIPYGARFRLKASFDLARIANPRARTLARAMQQYGMFVASSGAPPLAVRSDRSTKSKWGAMGIDASSLETLTIADFEVLQMGPPTDWLADSTCYREP